MTMRKGVIYSNISEDHKVAVGYLIWYESQYKCNAIRMFSNQYSPEIMLKILERLENKKWKFAGHVRKSHHVCIPVDCIFMKLTEFLRQQADEVLKELEPPKFEQMEFDFK